MQNVFPCWSQPMSLHWTSCPRDLQRGTESLQRGRRDPVPVDGQCSPPGHYFFPCFRPQGFYWLQQSDLCLCLLDLTRPIMDCYCPDWCFAPQAVGEASPLQVPHFSAYYVMVRVNFHAISYVADIHLFKLSIILDLLHPSIFHCNNPGGLYRHTLGGNLRC